VLVLNRAQVEALIDLDLLIDALAAAMADLSAGRASVPPRIAAFVPQHDGLLGAMPGYVPSAGVLMSKLVTLYPGNAGTALPTHQAIIATFDPETGRPSALLAGRAITAIRTGAGSALSARLLARPDSTVLAILGTGVQARSHVNAMCRVRPIREIRIAGSDLSRAAVLAAQLSATTDAEVRAVPSYREALDSADIACATTHAAKPVVRRDWLAPGTQITSVGYNPTGREVDAATVADALVVVESRAAALAPLPAGSNDLLMPIADGVISAEHVYAEIGELVAGTKPGRQSIEDITLYKSVGVAVQDAAAAALVVAAALAQGIGQHIKLE
jgi:ornithine cyclodeaminase/alanine dehydrogenase-like protein (mu-crystallin family)